MTQDLATDSEHSQLEEDITGRSREQQVRMPEKSQTPLVSVIVPTMGRATKIARSLSSICRQDYQNIEIIVVDDNGPSENRELTLRAIRELRPSVPLKVVETTGRIGGGPARNLAVAASAGEYLAFLDDDDEYLPGKIRLQMRFMLENGLDLSYQDVTWADESGRVVETRRLNHVETFDRPGLLRAHLVKPISPTAIYMIRRDYFARTDGFGSVDVGQDWLLMLQCIEIGGKIGYMEGAYVRQYLHDGPRLSTGVRKIRGEKAMQKIREAHASELSRRDRQAMRFRHFAVLAVSSLRSKFYLRALLYTAATVIRFPALAVREAVTYAHGTGAPNRP